MALKEEIRLDKAQPFTMNGTPLLAAGQVTDLLARGSQLWLHAKVYSAGGENGLHHHPHEDHAFFVLQGEATFNAQDGTTTTVGPYSGYLIPRGVDYSFQSSGEGNLVMLRIGAGDTTGEAPTVEFPQAMATRAGIQFESSENKTGSIPGEPIPGAFFGSPPEG